jgi:hypothetical protein
MAAGFQFNDDVNEAPCGIQNITSLNTVKTLTAPPKGNPNVVYMQAVTQDVYYTDDGTTPSATAGLLLKAGAAPTRFVGKIDALQFIEAAASAVLKVAYCQVARRN